MTYRLQAKSKKNIKLRANKLRLGDASILSNMYTDIVRGWQKQIKTIILPKYTTAIDELTRDDWLSDIGDALTSAGLALLAIGQALKPRLTIWIIRIETYTVINWTRIVQSGTGMDNTVLIDRSRVNAIARAGETQINKSMVGFNEAMQSRINEIVWTGLQTRKTTGQIAEELSKYLKISMRRAKLIAEQQAQRLHAAIDRYLQEEASLNSYVWRHTPQEHPRIHHVARDFRVFRWDTPPFDGPPGTQPYCKCYTQAVVPPLSTDTRQGILVR